MPEPLDALRTELLVRGDDHLSAHHFKRDRARDRIDWLLGGPLDVAWGSLAIGSVAVDRCVLRNRRLHSLLGGRRLRTRGSVGPRPSHVAVRCRRTWLRGRTPLALEDPWPIELDAGIRLFDPANGVGIERRASNPDAGRRTEPVKDSRTRPAAPPFGVDDEGIFVTALVAVEPQVWQSPTSFSATPTRTCVVRRRAMTRPRAVWRAPPAASSLPSPLGASPHVLRSVSSCPWHRPHVRLARSAGCPAPRGQLAAVPIAARRRTSIPRWAPDEPFGTRSDRRSCGTSKSPTRSPDSRPPAVARYPPTPRGHTDGTVRVPYRGAPTAREPPGD